MNILNGTTTMILQYLFLVKNKGSKSVVCARVGGANTTPFLAAHFAKRNTKNCGGEKRSGESEGGQKFLPPNPLPFCPPERSVLVLPREARQSVGILFKKSSNINQKRPPNCTFSEIERCCLGAKRLGMVFFRNFEGIFEIQKQRAVGNAEVRTNLFEKIPNPFGIFLLSVFFGLVGVF